MVVQKLFERLGRVGGSSRPADVSTTPAGRGPAGSVAPSAAPTEPRAVLAEVEAALARGDAAGAVDLLAAANRRSPAAELELALVDLRHEAAGLVAANERSPWPPTYADPFPDVFGELPEIPARELDVDVLGGSVAHHGCLVVRGLFDDDQIDRTIRSTRNAEARRSAPDAETSTDRWYRPFPKVKPVDRGLRAMVARNGGTWLADSPASCALVLDDLARTGAIDVIARHFGDRPLISLQKSTLRHSPPIHNFAGWHQDGSFLGPDVRAMNVWIALTPCGGDRPTPGIELVPRRIEAILPTDGGLGSASISDASTLRAARDTPPICPLFEPGDAMLFDERFLHRTHLTPGMVDDRYALECWFFAPAHDGEEYLSFLV